MKAKLTKWKIEDYLKTQKDRALYIEAAMEEETADALPNALADVYRSQGKMAEAVACEGLAAYLRAIAPTIKTAHKTRRKTEKA